jgi:hypothetical protein
MITYVLIVASTFGSAAPVRISNFSTIEQCEKGKATWLSTYKGMQAFCFEDVVQKVQCDDGGGLAKKR